MDISTKQALKPFIVAYLTGKRIGPLSEPVIKKKAVRKVSVDPAKYPVGENPGAECR